MLADKQRQLNERLAQLRLLFANDLPNRIGAIQARWNEARAQAFAAPVLRELAQLLHSLVGAAGTFGYEDLSNQARVVEQAVVRALAGAGTPEPAEIDRLDAGLATLVALAAAGTDSALPDSSRMRSHGQHTADQAGTRP